MHTCKLLHISVCLHIHDKTLLLFDSPLHTHLKRFQLHKKRNSTARNGAVSYTHLPIMYEIILYHIATAKMWNTSLVTNT